jgi:hypothetical protein
MDAICCECVAEFGFFMGDINMTISDDLPSNSPSISSRSKMSAKSPKIGFLRDSSSLYVSTSVFTLQYLQLVNFESRTAAVLPFNSSQNRSQTQISY